MVDMYCDFMQTESIKFEELKSDYDRVAVLDTPFAEAFQSAFLKLFSVVGLPELNLERFQHLAEQL